MLPHWFELVLRIFDQCMHVLSLLHVASHKKKQILQLLIVLFWLNLNSFVDGFQSLFVALYFLAVIEEESRIVVPGCG